LGTGQSGHIAAVGYDLYCQMVNEAVAELQGEEPHVPAEIKLELPLDAHLPADYVEREDLRLEAYRRLAGVATPDEVEDIRNEWVDRFGPLPPPAEALLDVARLRAECARVGVREVTVARGTGIGGPKWVARIEPLALKTSKVVRLERLYKKAVYKAEQRQLQLPVKDLARVVDELVAAFEDLVPEEAPVPA
jgi:transcription-repair coupling factor (superfamily II helicase)